MSSGRFGASCRAPESKYTTKVRSCAGKTPSDGFKWRKYGQKSIKNNPYPRCKLVSFFICVIDCSHLLYSLVDVVVDVHSSTNASIYTRHWTDNVQPKCKNQYYCAALD